MRTKLCLPVFRRVSSTDFDKVHPNVVEVFEGPTSRQSQNVHPALAIIPIAQHLLDPDIATHEEYCRQVSPSSSPELLRPARWHTYSLEDLDRE